MFFVSTDGLISINLLDFWLCLGAGRRLLYMSPAWRGLIRTILALLHGSELAIEHTVDLDALVYLDAPLIFVMTFLGTRCIMLREHVWTIKRILLAVQGEVF